jgi:RNA polymerase II subunit A-like phosphatase
VKENGELKASGGKRRTHGGESEREEGEVSEDSRLGSGDSSNSCVKNTGASRSSTDTDSNKEEKRTKKNCGDAKQETRLVRDLCEEGGSRDEEDRDRMASGDLTGDQELSDERDAYQTKATTLEDAGETEEVRTITKKGSEETEKHEEAVESGVMADSCGEGNGVVVTDASGGEDRGGVEDELVEVEDGDDYLMYLEEILKTVHKAFYDLYDEMNGVVPDLKSVIPYVRRKVLSGTSLVFSGLVPTHTPLEKSRAYLVARSMGAQVTQDLTPETTHLVAVRPGTAKVNSARRIARNVIIVTPDWLWCCGERWEKVDER